MRILGRFKPIAQEAEKGREMKSGLSKEQVLTPLSSLLAALTIIGNLLVVVILLAKPSLRKVRSNLFVVSLGECCSGNGRQAETGHGFEPGMNVFPSVKCIPNKTPVGCERGDSRGGNLQGEKKGFGFSKYGQTAAI